MIWPRFPFTLSYLALLMPGDLIDDTIPLPVYPFDISRRLLEKLSARHISGSGELAERDDEVSAMHWRAADYETAL